MSSVPSNETYYRRYLIDPLTITTQAVQKETAQENLNLHSGLSTEQAAFNQQLLSAFPRLPQEGVTRSA